VGQGAFVAVRQKRLLRVAQGAVSLEDGGQERLDTCGLMRGHVVSPLLVPDGARAFTYHENPNGNIVGCNLRWCLRESPT
jgi:hypothetical protein